MGGQWNEFHDLTRLDPDPSDISTDDKQHKADLAFNEVVIDIASRLDPDGGNLTPSDIEEIMSTADLAVIQERSGYKNAATDYEDCQPCEETVSQFDEAFPPAEPW